MYELMRTMHFAKDAISKNKRIAFATIVKTEGSSYRKVWSKMVIADDYSFQGYLSGGCVEKEILRHCEGVFRNTKNDLFSYDGSYRLGCEGIIYINIELVDPDSFDHLYSKVCQADTSRITFYQGIVTDTETDKVHSFYQFEDGSKYYLDKERSGKEELKEILPHKQLLVVGHEYDSELLVRLASQLGYRIVHLVGQHYTIPAVTSKDLRIVSLEPEELSETIIMDSRTAVILMSHSYHRDLKYVQEFIKYPLCYLGTLGPRKRKHKIINYLLDNDLSADDDVLENIDKIKGPIGLDIPSRTPEDIAIAILADLVCAFGE